MNIQTALNDFLRTHQSLVMKASSALESGNTASVKTILKSVENSSVAKLLASKLSNSKKAMDEFITEMEKLGLFGKMIGGLTAVAAGAFVMKGFGALMSVIGLALMAWGIYTALTATWDIVKWKMQEMLAGM
ncbi:hypothetical protein OVA24_14760 [Luteolibacter sp. SL250]|uniref:hypothetical protein n=1 Tax=Luteolibacter sp. SL250 TaxID=2995170 RepID=UPI0022700C85|nr:hypothetical protein [Luteolibacter sp. SL250]WAC18494.1 hypothetical protein OVA24_14760 [Luteolibacter sp. SL250]